jgi:hypothetical protein
MRQWIHALAVAGGLWATAPTSQAAETMLAPGALLPAFTGEDLAGHDVTLPEASRGKVALIAFGFSYDSRKPVEAWTAHARTTWGTDARFAWYQVPMIGGFGRLAKPFITGGMRKETPAQYHGNAVTVFGGVGPWKTRLGVKDDGLAYLVLIDRTGIVRWLHAGPFVPAKAAEFDDQVRALLAPPAAR